ncbi:MAG: hypothetical protein Q8733_01360 [Pigeon pea little leaf phytoplasma]|nr:hypothetical protein [Pigeon pea little leaf phytoplasma]
MINNMQIDIITIFPNFFDYFLNHSILKRAKEKNKVIMMKLEILISVSTTVLSKTMLKTFFDGGFSKIVLKKFTLFFSVIVLTS